MAETFRKDTEGEQNIRTCENCKHFRQHFARDTRGYYNSLLYGHCVKPRVKKRFIGDKGCSYWEERTENRK